MCHLAELEKKERTGRDTRRDVFVRLSTHLPVQARGRGRAPLRLLLRGRGGKGSKEG